MKFLGEISEISPAGIKTEFFILRLDFYVNKVVGDD